MSLQPGINPLDRRMQPGNDERKNWYENYGSKRSESRYP